jgi:4-alpha-glucanotransferase
MKRSSGVLLHPTSLPGGVIGTLGPAARSFVDFLAETGQRNWQMLPVNPPGLGGSPYMATSAFAGSPSLLDPDDLVADGLLSPSERPLSTQGQVDFDLVESESARVLSSVASRVDRHDTELAAYCARTSWLEDYAAFSVLTATYGDTDWTAWAPEYRDRDATVLAGLDSGALHEARVGQFLFDRQWRALRDYAQRAGVALIGDIPIFVAHGSADVWANRSLFQLDPIGSPIEVAGVPPDYFSETGQRWGNPLYAWDAMKGRAYTWWTERFLHMFAHFDRVRVDHFRAFAAYWSIPAHLQTAIGGRWITGPGLGFFEQIADNLGLGRDHLADLPILLEDLGIITADVDVLRSVLGLPGMKVLQFSFDDEWDNVHKPHNYPPDGGCVVYSGTHDNDTATGWYANASEADRARARVHLAIDGATFARDLVGAAWRSSADLAIAPLQDLLGLGSEARMNTPGTPTGNWTWRMDGPVAPEDVSWLLPLTAESGRTSAG